MVFGAFLCNRKFLGILYYIKKEENTLIAVAYIVVIV